MTKSRATSILLYLSIALNLVLLAAGSLLYFPQYREIPLSEVELKKAIRENSWNSAGSWWLVEDDDERALIEYKLPPFEFARFTLSKEDFMIRRDLSARPAKLAFEGCDLVSKRTGECIKFRDLTSERCSD